MTVQFGFAQTSSSTSEGNQTFTDANMSETVKAAVFFVSKGTSLGSDQGDLNLGYGVCNSTDEWSISSNDDTGSDPTDSTRSFKTNRCVHFFASGTTTSHRMDANWVSFGAGTVTINHNSAPSSAYIITVFMFGGSSFVSDIGTGTPNTTVGLTTTISSLSFQTEGGLFGYTGEDPNNTTAQNNHQIGMGFMSYDGSTITQRCHTQRSDNGDTSGSEVRQGISKSRIVMGVNSSGDEIEGLEVTAVTSNSVTITTRNSAANNDFGYFLFTMGGDSRVIVGDIESPTSDGTDPITNTGFEPRGLFAVMTSLTTTNLTDNDEHAGSFAYGGAIVDEGDTLRQGSIRGAIEDASDPTDTESSTENVIFRVTDDDSSVGVEATINSFDSDGFTPDWTDTKGVSWAGFYMAFGEPDSTISGTASITLSGATVDSAADLEIAATLSSTLDQATLASASQLEIEGVATPSLENASLTSASEIDIDGALSKSLADAALLSSGELDIDGTASAALSDATVSAAGDVEIAGSTSQTLQNATVDAVASLGASGVTNTTLSDATVTSAASLDIAATASISVQDATVSAQASLDIEGQSSPNLTPATAASAGTVDITGSVAKSLGDATVTSAGIAQSGLIGETTVTLSDATVSSSATVDVTATVAASTENASVTASADLDIKGTLDATLAPARAESASTVETEGQASISLSPAILLSAGDVLIEGLTAITLEAATIASIGSSTVATVSLVTSQGKVYSPSIQGKIQAPAISGKTRSPANVGKVKAQ